MNQIWVIRVVVSVYGYRHSLFQSDEWAWSSPVVTHGLDNFAGSQFNGHRGDAECEVCGVRVLDGKYFRQAVRGENGSTYGARGPATGK
jgi:hypothetical protein